jgi:TetR/AcrR family transcriptional repressor of nem operon
MPPPPDTKERLVASAAMLWHAKSYADVGVNEICAEAGVKKGSFYHFFPSKSDVALAVLDFRCEQAIASLFRPVLSSESSPLESLTRLIEIQYELQKQIQADTGAVLGCPIGNFSLELSTRDERVRQRCVELLEEWALQIEPLLEAAVQEGELPPIDVGRASMAVTAYIEGILLLAKTRNDAEVIQDLAAGARQLVVAFRCDDDNR